MAARTARKRLGLPSLHRKAVKMTNAGMVDVGNKIKGLLVFGQLQVADLVLAGRQLVSRSGTDIHRIDMGIPSRFALKEHRMVVNPAQCPPAPRSADTGSG